MPNGFSGSQQEWARMEAPLVEIDPALANFAEQHGMTLSKNYHNSPERSLVWDGGIRRLIQIYLENEKAMTWNMWLCASQDRDKQRFWKNHFLKKSVPMDEIRRDLPALLEQGRTMLDAWSERDLQQAP